MKLPKMKFEWLCLILAVSMVGLSIARRGQCKDGHVYQDHTGEWKCIECGHVNAYHVLMPGDAIEGFYE